MKSLTVTLLLFCLTVGGIALNYVHVNRVCDTLAEQIEEIPDVSDPNCTAAVRALTDYWLSRVKTVEFSAGFSAVDRISEQAAVLLACAECGDLYGFRTALVLLADAAEDLRRPELFSLGTLL